MNKLLKKLILGFNTPLCLCRNCSTFPDKGDHRVYCESAASKFPINMRNCRCPECIVFKLNSFKEHYYCSIGKSPESKI